MFVGGGEGVPLPTPKQLSNYVRESALSILGYKSLDGLLKALHGRMNNASADLTNHLLVSTAVPQQENGVYVSPRRQGAGLVNAAAAISTPAYIDVDGKLVGKLELGDDPGWSGSYDLDFRVENLGSDTLSYSMKAVLLRPDTAEQDGKTMVLASDVLIREVDLGSVSVPTGGTQVSRTVSLTASDIAAIRELAEKSDVLTYEFENVDADAIDQVRSLAAAPQGTDLLRVTQDRVNEKRFINDHGTPTTPWKAVNSVEELEAALDEIHYPAVLKTRSGGYDGHGQTVLKSEADLEQVRARADHDGSFPPSILEGFVDFAFEASILVAGNGKDYVTFPIVRNEHRNNILHMTIAPAEVDETVAKEAHELALRLAKGFELAGILAIELFITKDDQVIVNELAPRPHNSGHYTIEACSMDQFDAHIRGIAGWPMPKPKLLSPAVMVNVLGQHVEPTRALIATHPEWNVHDYGKAEVRHDRKMGHITVLTDDPAKTVADLEATGCWDDLKKKA